MMIQERDIPMPKRRKFSPEFKARVVLEVLTGVKTSAQVAREYGISVQLLSNWKATFLENASSLFERNNHNSEDKLRIDELERLAGRQALEIEILKKASDILRAHQNGNEK
jgi:transposase-like protein